MGFLDIACRFIDQCLKDQSFGSAERDNPAPHSTTRHYSSYSDDEPTVIEEDDDDKDTSDPIATAFALGLLDRDR